MTPAHHGEAEEASAAQQRMAADSGMSSVIKTSPLPVRKSATRFSENW
jgi:hypothetical protein